MAACWPIVNENDTVSVSELKFGDNDCLASLLVNLTGADLFINLTSSPACWPPIPSGNPTRRLWTISTTWRPWILANSAAAKLPWARAACIPNCWPPGAPPRSACHPDPAGREPDVLVRVFDAAGAGGGGRNPDGNCRGLGSPAGHAIPRRKFWLAYHSEPGGPT